MDGIGGTVKNQVFREAISGRSFVESVHHFSLHAYRIMETFATINLLNEQVHVEPTDTDEPPYIKGTLKVHKLV